MADAAQHGRTALPPCSTRDSVLRMEYPLYAMRMLDFLALETLRPHNGLVEEGLVVPLDLDGEHARANVNFVSHQWLGFAEADPNGDHLATMQAAFRRAIDEPRALFKDADDWSSFARGSTAANLASLTTTREAVRGDDGSETVAATVDHEDGSMHSAFAEATRSGWVWMDYLSVPQTIGLPDPAAVAAALADQAKAIRSIPSYIRRARTFWICTPAGARHEAGHACSYATWHERGWCRLEETAISLAHLGDARPLLLSEPVGAPPLATVPDYVDWISFKTQRRTSVFNGAFTCCRLGHRVATRDGATTVIPCDKTALRAVLGDLCDESLARAAARVADDEQHGSVAFGDVGSFWSSISHSFTADAHHSYFNWYATASEPRALSLSCLF